MEIIGFFGIVLLITVLFVNISVTLCMTIYYPFNKKEYVTEKWKSLFPYLFEIKWKTVNPDGTYFLYTNTPSLLPIIGEGNFKMERIVYTKEYVESEEFKKLSEHVRDIIKNAKIRRYGRDNFEN